MTTPCYILDFDRTPYFQGTLQYAEQTNRTALVTDPFGDRITYYHWTDRII